MAANVEFNLATNYAEGVVLHVEPVNASPYVDLASCHPSIGILICGLLPYHGLRSSTSTSRFTNITDFCSLTDSQHSIHLREP